MVRRRRLQAGEMEELRKSLLDLQTELKDAKGTAIELWKSWVTVKLDYSGEILKRRAHTLVTAPPVGWVPGQECASPKKRKKCRGRTKKTP